MVTRSRARERIVVEPFAAASARHRRELAAFARYCIHRLERDLGERDAWTVHVAPAPFGGYASRVVVRDRGAILEQDGWGHDGPLAIWDALCRLEQRLCERRY